MINQNLTYPIALLLSNSVKKNFESLGREVSISGDSITRILMSNAITTDDLLAFCTLIFGKKAVYLIVDDTLIKKIYSRLIEGACDNYDSSQHQHYRSLCSVVAMITDGETAIPVDQKLWFSEEYNPDNHQKKWEIAKELLVKIRPLIRLKTFIADGLYAVVEFMIWLIKSSINFEMRMHSNRVIEFKGIKAQVRKHPRLKVTTRNSLRTIKIIWQGMTLYVTAFLRVMKTGKVTIIYQVANYKTTATKHVQCYKYRWNIEKFFRTAKQYLGLNDCMARKQQAQEYHIMNVFLAYAFAQYERLRLKLKNVESAIKSFKQSNFNTLHTKLSAKLQIFYRA
jgi:hypothetical protein